MENTKIIILVFLASFKCLVCYSQSNLVDNEGEAYFYHINDFPHDGDVFWGGDNYAANGIASDDKYWYISSIRRNWLGITGSDWVLYKVPFGTSLNNNSTPSTIIKKYSTSYSATHELHGFGHIGDIDFLQYGTSGGYIVAPIYNSEHSYSKIALFRSSDLKYISYALIPFHAGWCAVKREGNHDYLYSSKHQAYSICKFRIDWDLILKNNGKGLIFIDSSTIDHAAFPFGIRNMQGGDFSPSGNLLYISSGLFDCDPSDQGGFWGSVFGTIFGGPFWGGLGALFGSIGADIFADATHAHSEDGISCLQYVNGIWRKKEHSINSKRSNSFSCFGFSYDNFECSDLEPEGLTITHEAEGKAPGIYGELHVILDDHNPPGGRTNLHHFRSFKCPESIKVVGSSQTGVPISNNAISDFLEVGSPIFGNTIQSYYGCGLITHNAPNLFYPGVTPIEFNVTYTNTKSISCESNVTVLNAHDDFDEALLLHPCERIVTNNICANTSIAPAFSCYNGLVKDVWCKINDPKTSAFSVETYQVNNGISNTVMQLLSYDNGNFLEIASDDTSGENGTHSKITVNNYSGSWPIYVRITEFNSNNFGEFGLYYKKLEVNSNLFTEAEDITSDGPEVMDRPALYGDFNGDGMSDLIFIGQDWGGNTNLNIRTKMSNGDGTYTSYSQQMIDGSGVLTYPTLIGDINGDGKTDIIFVGQDWGGNTNLNIRTKMSNGDGTFTSYSQQMSDGSGVHTYPTLTGDINGDGKTDIIFVGQDWGGDTNLNIRVKMSNGDGSFTSYSQQMSDGSGVHTYPTLTGDVNGDGKTDLIFVGQDWGGNTNLNIRVKMSNGDGTFTSYSQQLSDGSGVHTYPTLTGDVNGDGKTDLIFVGQNWKACGLNVRVKISNGDGTWCSDWQSLGDGSAVHTNPAIVMDANNDNKSDIVFIGMNWSSPGLNIRTKLSQVTSCNNLSDDFGSKYSSPYTIYPNPSEGFFRIASNSITTFDVYLYDHSGVLKEIFKNASSDDNFDISLLSNGVYFVEIINHTSKERTTRKLVKLL